jgi:hypothetical protein
VQKIMLQHSENFAQVQSSCRHAIQNLMGKIRARSAQHVNMDCHNGRSEEIQGSSWGQV